MAASADSGEIAISSRRKSADRRADRGIPAERFRQNARNHNEIAVILQAAGKKSFACGFQGSGKIARSGMIDFEGHRLDTPVRIPSAISRAWPSKPNP